MGEISFEAVSPELKVMTEANWKVAHIEVNHQSGFSAYCLVLLRHLIACYRWINKCLEFNFLNRNQRTSFATADTSTYLCIIRVRQQHRILLILFFVWLSLNWNRHQQVQKIDNQRACVHVSDTIYKAHINWPAHFHHWCTQFATVRCALLRTTCERKYNLKMKHILFTHSKR